MGRFIYKNTTHPPTYEAFPDSPQNMDNLGVSGFTLLSAEAAGGALGGGRHRSRRAQLLQHAGVRLTATGLRAERCVGSIFEKETSPPYSLCTTF